MSVSSLTPPATDPGTPLASLPLLPGVSPTALSAALHGSLRIDDDLPHDITEAFLRPDDTYNLNLWSMMWQECTPPVQIFGVFDSC